MADMALELRSIGKTKISFNPFTKFSLLFHKFMAAFMADIALEPWNNEDNFSLFY